MFQKTWQRYKYNMKNQHHMMIFNNYIFGGPKGSFVIMSPNER